MFLTNAVANDILKLAKEEHINITPLKLQKIMYFLAGKYIADTGEPLFTEHFRAWLYGPVLPSVYQEFRSYGSSPIRFYSTDAKGLAWFTRDDLPENNNYFKALESTWNKYKNYSAKKLVDLTHTKDSPWARTKCNAAIDDNKMMEYFKNER